ncbi:3D domain-containing protein [Deinococcus sp. VB343]|uniref:3D domain-containing protein n=1 Tax=Deinococcus sp. VB142 TaxID=3112952 RepID=A0AAU6Q5N2_9DEIO
MSRVLKSALSASALFACLLLCQGQAQTAQSSSAAQVRANLAVIKPILEYAEQVEEELVLTTTAPVPAVTVPAVTARTAPAPVKAAPAPQVSAPTRATEVVAAARATGRSMVVKATAYNSLANQTDSTPHITATGTRTRPGVIALSRDLLRAFPYGTRVTLQDLSGRYNFSGRVFVVEDTMHVRKTNQVDIWMPTYNEAIRFGTGTVRITALR